MKGRRVKGSCVLCGKKIWSAPLWTNTPRGYGPVHVDCPELYRRLGAASRPDTGQKG